jgi:phenylacetate-CoA ligase
MTVQNNFFEKDLETLPQEQIKALQLERLKNVVEFAYNSNDIHKNRFQTASVSPDDINSLDDIQKLPFMDKAFLRDNYPTKLACVGAEDFHEMHMSSGSTGTPVVMPYTIEDLNQWGQCMARCYSMAGANPSDVVQITPSFGLFNGGFGMYHGARAANLFIIPTGAGNTERQIKLAKDFKTRILTGVVSYGIRIMEVLQDMKQTLPDLEIGIFGAEVFSDSMKQKIQKGLGIEAFDIYGMTETGGVGTLGMDCIAHNGIHVWEDHYYCEIIDPDSGETVEDGQFGELVITSLTRKALPVIRFKTGDLTRIVTRQKCDCERTHLKIETITGRADDMLIVKGVNFWPKQVEQTLMKIDGVGSNYQIIIEETNGVKDVRINVEAEPSVTGHTVVKALKEVLGFTPKGDVFPIGHLPRQQGKAKRVFFENPEK